MSRPRVPDTCRRRDRPCATVWGCGSGGRAPARIPDGGGRRGGGCAARPGGPWRIFVSVGVPRSTPLGISLSAASDQPTATRAPTGRRETSCAVCLRGRRSYSFAVGSHSTRPTRRPVPGSCRLTVYLFKRVRAGQRRPRQVPPPGTHRARRCDRGRTWGRDRRSRGGTGVAWATRRWPAGAPHRASPVRCAH